MGQVRREPVDHGLDAAEISGQRARKLRRADTDEMQFGESGGVSERRAEAEPPARDVTNQ
jgi:hypothetical protein